MKHHKIKSIDDIKKLQAIYEDGAIFEILETGEEMELTNLLFFYDGQEITIQHI
jgi:hypothetical protein